MNDLHRLIEIVSACWDLIVALWNWGWVGRIALLALAGYLKVLIAWVRRGSFVHG